MTTAGRGADLPYAPLEYPGTPAVAPLLLGPGVALALRWTGNRLHRSDGARVGDRPDHGWHGVGGLDHVLREAGAAAMADRVPVVAIGSNRVPAVMATKLATAGASPWLPMAPALMIGVAVGHSAHVSRGGYIAAAPYVRPGAQTAVVVSWLDADQLAAVDVTEPNYRRLPLGDHGAVVAEHGPAIPAAELYVSRHGVLAAAGSVVPFGAQLEVFRWLAATPALAALAPWLDPEPEAVVRVIQGAHWRTEFRRVTAAEGYAQDSGFPVGTGGPAAG